MPSNSRRLAGGLLYVAFLALCAEVALQGFYYFTAGDFLFRRVGLALYVPNEHSGFAVKPNLDFEQRTNEFQARVFTNGQGFRVAEPQRVFAQTPDPETTRVMLLGPSFAFGWGVDYDQSYAAILERTLDAAGYGDGQRVELLNAGVPAMAATHHLEWYRHEGRLFQPDLVVQFIYGSMLPPPYSRQRYVVTEEGYLERPQDGFLRKVQATVKNSALVFYGWTAYARLRSGPADEADQAEIQGAGRHLTQAEAFSVDDPKVQQGFDFYADLRETVEASGAELLVVYFPLSYVVHEEDMSRWQHLGVRDVAQQVAFDDAFCRALTVQGVDCLNLTPELERAADAGERLYFWLDIHWTERGNAVTAEATARHLLSRSAQP